MKTIFNIPLTCFFLFSATFLFSQENPEKATIDDQFNELMTESNSYKEYKVVKKTSLIDLQEKTNAEISKLEEEIVSANTTIKTQQEEISSLNASLEKTQANLTQATKAKEEIAMLGVPTSKATFRTTMWTLVFVLAILLVFFVYKFKNSNLQTKEAHKNLQETENEYEEYRKSALEKQQKIGRMLQDERNKAVKMTQN